MTWTSIFTSETWPMAALIFLLLFLAGYSWRRRSVPGALQFMTGCLFTLPVMVGLLITNLGIRPELRIFWLRFSLSWVLMGATAITCFVLEYAWPGRWLTRRNLVLLSIVPLFYIFYFLGGGDGLIGPAPFQVGVPIPLTSFPVKLFFIVYNMILTLLNLAIFAWLFIRSPQHRWPVVLMASAETLIMISILQKIPASEDQVDNFPLAILPFLSYAIALYGFRIFDPIPLARQTAIDQMHAGMIVLNPQGRVVSLNPAAERILGTTTSQPRNRRVRELLPDCSQDLLEKPPGMETEYSLGSRSYTLSLSQLRDFRGLVVGSILMLRDITEQKQAQAQILEQQRVLATQNERERMARELHDSLGQVLGYASLQVQTAARLSRTGQGEAAGDQLDRLDSVVREAHADLREYILNLRSTTSLQQPFFVTIQQYLDSFTTNYDIHAMLSFTPDLCEAIFLPETQLQLFRILQEALSNARKHGQAHQAQVSFSVENGSLHMVIADDGCGFDLQEIARREGAHYGLQFMRERAAQLEGSLEVHSALGTGTRVELVIPWKEG